ncbi:conserved hypothetical protein [Vibrio phage 249E41-1]|nr:conserved hypothetical protein [Vibrio phage 249E41-1]
MMLSEITNPLFVSNNGERVQLTEETLTKTCQWFADNAQGCIDEVLSGEVKVNDQAAYIETKKALIKCFLSRDFEIGLWFYQKALYIQTGESVPMFN